MSTGQTPILTATEAIAAKTHKDLPPHLDISARNERLYRALLGMGYWVEPVYSDTSMENISYLRVSTAAIIPTTY